jgi:hypothetical protein
MLTVGALVAMGCKENFLVLLPAIWFWLAVLWWRRPLPWGGRVAAVAITAGGVFIAATVGSALRQVQADVYKHSVSPGGRLQLLIPALQAFVTRPEGLALAGGLLLLASIGPAGPSARFRRRLLVGAAAVVALVGLYVSQYVFYLGDFPRTQRYDFPGLMVYPVLAGVEAWLLAGWLRARGWLRVRRVLMVVTLAGLTAGVAVRGFPFQGAVAANVAHTQPLARHLAAVIARLQAEPGRPLLLDSHSAGDYEPILAVRRILAVRGVTNPCFLRLNGYTPESYGLTDYRDQAEQLQNLSLRGRHGDLGPPWTFVPLEQLPAEPRPFGLGFAAPPGPDTESLGRLW